MDDIRALFRTVETLLRDGDECLRNWLGTIFFEYVATEMRVLYRRGALTRTEILGILGPCSRQEWGCWLTPAPR